MLLADQDRDDWDRAMIEEGVTLVGVGLRRTPAHPDPLRRAGGDRRLPRAGADATPDTDWDAIVSWYDVLLSVQDTPIIRLNRAVAVGECEGPLAALALIDDLDSLAGYPLWHASRAELLRRAGRHDDAHAALRAALALPMNAAQQRLLEERLRTC